MTALAIAAIRHRRGKDIECLSVNERGTVSRIQSVSYSGCGTLPSECLSERVMRKDASGYIVG